MKNVIRHAEMTESELLKLYRDSDEVRQLADRLHYFDARESGDICIECIRRAAARLEIEV